ncbi:zinc finger, CCHC-type containing protein [Tanacetum coccineum]|uniref:Zinc finger, CCHC-type containing protein n=1 Tax=Tanacetum coccineum TaxID=301880 RepID=A0ABQ5ILL7_9ASTR
MQKEPGKPKEVVYSNSKIIQVIKTYWELGHEHKFITEIVARRANECIVSITKPNYKNLNKNDIEDMYLLIMNGKVPDYVETCLMWSLSVFIRSSVIWERVHDFQLGIESYQLKVNLAALIISFQELKSIKYLIEDEVEYLKLFVEEIEVRLKYHNQMRRWEIKGTDTAYLLLYVDDIVLIASFESLLQQIIRSFHQEYAMTDMGPLSYFLGISVTRDSSGLFLSQKKYAVESFERTGMVNCNPSRTPVDTKSKLGDTGVVVFDPTLYRSLSGSLQYLIFT